MFVDKIKVAIAVIVIIAIVIVVWYSFNVHVDDPLAREVNGVMVTGDLTSLDFTSYEAYKKYSSHKKEEMDSLTEKDFASAKSYEIFLADYRAEISPPVAGENDPPGGPWAGPDL